jgi:hypothetical protein
MHKVSGDVSDQWGFGHIEKGKAMKPTMGLSMYYDKPNFRKSKVVGSNATEVESPVCICIS